VGKKRIHIKKSSECILQRENIFKREEGENQSHRGVRKEKREKIGKKIDLAIPIIYLFIYNVFGLRPNTLFIYLYVFLQII